MENGVFPWSLKEVDHDIRTYLTGCYLSMHRLSYKIVVICEVNLLLVSLLSLKISLFQSWLQPGDILNPAEIYCIYEIYEIFGSTKYMNICTAGNI